MQDTYNFKQLRGIKEMTQDEIAKELGISKYTWINWESGKTAPDFWQLQKIKTLFGISIDNIKVLPKK